jgi:hypothetical protein
LAGKGTCGFSGLNNQKSLRKIAPLDRMFFAGENFTDMGIKEKLKIKVVRYILKILSKLPQRVSEALVRVVMEKIWRQKIANLTQILASVKRFSENTNRNCQEKILGNLAFKGLIGNQQIRDECLRNGLPTLYTILISPTMRCNLKCDGCYAKSYQKKDDLPFEIMDRIVKEGKEIGVAFFTFLRSNPMFISRFLLTLHY